MDGMHQHDDQLTAAPLWQRIGLWPLWMAANAAAGLGSWAIVVLAFVLLDALPIGRQRLEYRSLIAFLSFLLLAPSLALAQWLLLRHLVGLGVRGLAILTTIVSVAGLGIGFALARPVLPLLAIPSEWLFSSSPVTDYVPYSVLSRISNAWPSAMSGAFAFGTSFLLIGLVQWYALRGHTRETWRLIPRCLLAGAVMGLVFGHLPLQAFMGTLFSCRDPIMCLNPACTDYVCTGSVNPVPIYARLYFLFAVPGAVIYGLVSGGAMIELLRQLLEPGIDEGYPSPS